MPTYDYECTNGHRFEVFQKMSDEPVSECPDCGGAAVRKISGGAGFLFKGDGFYITDYRSDDYKKKASADQGDSPSKSTSDKAEKSDKSEKKGGSDAGASKPPSDS
jgi:putative FmdB family regulatory protein